MIVHIINNQKIITSHQSFCAMCCKDKKSMKLLTSMKTRHLDYLEKTIKEQRNSPIDINFRSKYGRLLTATLSCVYRIKNFKEHYIQKPLIESRISFIKRIVNQANEYKTQIETEAKLYPEAFLQGVNLRQKEIIKKLIEQ